MKKKVATILITIGIVLVISGVIIFNRDKIFKKKSNLEIIDATYVCAQVIEKFYEDDNYTYSFSCAKSSSVYVKFDNGNKMLVTTALEEKKVTIDELIDAGLDVIKEEK